MSRRTTSVLALSAVLLGLVGLAGPSSAATSAPAAVTTALHPVTVVVTTPKGGETPDQATTLQAVRDQMAALSTYWRGQSAGRVDFQVASLTWWPGQGVCGGDQDPIRDAAKAKVGYTSGSRKHFLLLTATCPSSSGVGTVPSSPDSGGNVTMQRVDSSGTYAHEFGHNLSFGHAGLLTCPGAEVDGAVTDEGGDCSVADYGDDLDTMGTSRRTMYKGFSVPSAIRVGWFVPGTDYVSVGPGTDQTVTIQSRDLLQGLRAVQVTDPRSGRVFSVEMATDTGWGAGLKDADGTTDTENGIEVNQSYGVRVLRTYKTQRTLLIPSAPVDGVRHTAWAPGQTFTSSTGGVAVTVVSTTATTATLRVRTAAVPGTHLVPVVTAPVSVAYGQQAPVVVTGTPGAVVSLQGRYSGVRTFSVLRTLRLDTSGRASTLIRPARSIALRAADSTRPTTFGRAPVVTVLTHRVPVVSAPASVRPRTAVDVVVTGTPGATVRLDRRYSGESTYTPIRTLRLDASGRAVARFTPARVFAVRSADTTRPTAYGPVRVVQVR